MRQQSHLSFCPHGDSHPHQTANVATPLTTAVSRRSFMQLVGAGAGLLLHPSARAAAGYQWLSLPTKDTTLNVAFLSDTHLYAHDMADPLAQAMQNAVDDINGLAAQPDLVVFGGDLAQMGDATAMQLGADILSKLKAPLVVVAGEHDWYLDMGHKWQALFGAPSRFFAHKNVFVASLFSAWHDDVFSAHNMEGIQRMHAMAGLNTDVPVNFKVGEAQLLALANALSPVPSSMPILVLSHVPPFDYYPAWGFDKREAMELKRLLARFDDVTVLYGHTHRAKDYKDGNTHYVAMASTAWPYPEPPTSTQQDLRSLSDASAPMLGPGNITLASTR